MGRTVIVSGLFKLSISQLRTDREMNLFVAKTCTTNTLLDLIGTVFLTLYDTDISTEDINSVRTARITVNPSSPKLKD